VGHDFFDGSYYHPVLSPRVDMQESRKVFYIDMELPGLEGVDKVALRWISSRTLLVQTTLERNGTPEDDAVPEDDTTDPADTPQPATTGASGIENKDQNKSTQKAKNPQVYLTVSERRLGQYARAFNFPVDVNHEKSTATLKSGVLRITVYKVEDGKKIDMAVNVESGDR